MMAMGQRTRLASTLFAWTLLLLIFAAGRNAQANPARDTAFEKKVLEEIAAENPEAARLFTEATAARDRGDGAAAKTGFQRVIEMAPKSDHAYRRLCGVESGSENAAAAIGHCRQALAIRESPENQLSLADAIVSDPQSTKVSIQEAADHAKRGFAVRQDDVHAVWVMIQLAFAQEDAAQLRQYTAHLEKIAGEDPQAHLLLGVVHGAGGRMDAARIELEKAKKYGLDDRQYQAARNTLDEREHSGIGYYAGRIAWIFAIWLCGFALLLGLGWILSQLVLRAAGEVALASSSLRRVYRAVIALTCIYFYASLPMVLLGVFAMAGGVVYAVVALGHIPIKLVLIVAVIAFVSLWAVLKAIYAILAPPKAEDPGESLDLATEPRLRELLQEVADRVGTRVVDRVFITTGTDLAVTERGGGLFRFRGRTERCLILGAGVLDGMPLRAFKAILAHEYGHFKNEDTAGGGFAFTMQRSLVTMAIALAHGGAASWLNPAWWFIRGFHPLFLRISHGASRLQEILADRWAATVYGSAAFEQGLRHVIERTVRFDAHASASLNEVIEKKIPLANFYTYAPETPIAEKDLADELEKVLARPASAYDSHPPPNQRIAWVHALNAAGEPKGEHEDVEAWSLFRDRAHIEERMTQRIHTNLAEQGIFLPGPAMPPPTP